MQNSLFDTNINQTLLKKHPQLVFNPIKFEPSDAVGLVIADDSLVVGVITEKGHLRKIGNPIALDQYSQLELQNMLSSVPVIKTLTSFDNTQLLNKTENAPETKPSESLAIQLSLEKSTDNPTCQHDFIYDDLLGKCIPVPKDSPDMSPKLLQFCTEQARNDVGAFRNALDERTKGWMLWFARHSNAAAVAKYVSELNDLKSRVNSIFEADIESANQLVAFIDTQIHNLNVLIQQTQA